MNANERPKNGKLIQTIPGGKSITILDNKPWSVLATKKKELIKNRPDLYNKDNLKSVYL